MDYRHDASWNARNRAERSEVAVDLEEFLEDWPRAFQLLSAQAEGMFSARSQYTLFNSSLVRFLLVSDSRNHPDSRGHLERRNCLQGHPNSSWHVFFTKTCHDFHGYHVPLWCSGLVGHQLELGVVEQFAGQALALGFGLEQPLPSCN